MRLRVLEPDDWLSLFRMKCWSMVLVLVLALIVPHVLVLVRFFGLLVRAGLVIPTRERRRMSTTRRPGTYPTSLGFS
jgi:hypothetical protein